MLRTSCLSLWTAACLACGSMPLEPAPGTSSVWGQVRLVPREGVVPGAAGGGSYGDRRLRDVEFVDYSRPGFAVVWVEGAAPAGEACQISIESRAAGATLRPRSCALGAGGTLSVANATPVPHVVSVPACGVVRRLEAGERTEIPVPSPGEQSVYLLDEPSASARAFVVPGPYSIASPAGRYVLRDLDPGERRIHVWHPRFPSLSQAIELGRDRAERVDLELSVGSLEATGGIPRGDP